MPEKKYHVFISYSSIDSEAAFSLLQVLENNGLRCWIAPRNIPQGAIWADEIDNAIQASRAFVVVFSSNATASKQVPKEIALAVSACEGIFPFRIDDTELRGSFRYYLSDYQFVDAVQQRERRMQELAEAIRAALKLPSAEPAAQPDAAPAAPAADEKPVPSAPAAPAADVKTAPSAPVMPPKDAAPASEAKKAVPAAAKKAAPVKKTVAPAKPPRKRRWLLPVILGLAGLLLVAVIIVVAAALLSRPAAVKPSAPASAASVQEEVAPVEPPEENPVEQPVFENGSEISPLFGGWELVNSADRGKASVRFSNNYFFVCIDGTTYTNMTEYCALSESGELPVLQWTQSGMNFTDVFPPSSNAEKYDLSSTCFLMDSYDETVPAQEGNTEPPVVKSVDPASIDLSKASFASCYPEKYLTVHVTGTYTESPVSILDVDTWLVYKQTIPVLSTHLVPTLVGDWKDSLENTWRFWPEGEDVAFILTESNGTVHTGRYVIDYPGDPDERDFYERVTFRFDDFGVEKHAIVCYDGMVLYLLNQNGEPFILTRTFDESDDASAG